MSSLLTSSRMAQPDSPAPLAPALTAAGLSFAAGDRLLVNGVGMSLTPGRLVGLIGPNGAGKSTLLRLVNGLLAPSAGYVRLDAQNLQQLTPEHVARQVARVPQTPAANLDFTVLEMVMMGRYVHSPGWQETAADLAASLEALGLTRTVHLAERLYSTLSGGERQRVMVARALAQQPKVLLLDEATANLDLRHQIEVLEVVRDLTVRWGIAAMAAIHDLTLAARYCDELLLLHEGCAVAAGTPDEVLTPERLGRVYGVDALVERHPVLGHLMIMVRGVHSAEEGA